MSNEGQGLGPAAKGGQGEPGSPLVDVLMLAYNVAPYIGSAIEGVLKQRTDFQIGLVIAEDRSTDDTAVLCERYARDHPDIIRFLPGERNLGIAGRAAAGIRHCHAKYLAICDGDDVWTDPSKLAMQVGFLEANDDHGLSYSDVSVISRNGDPGHDDIYDPFRTSYASGDVSLKLLRGNFINNSTVVVRRELLKDHVIDTDRGYCIHDYLMWLHVSMRTKVHFLQQRTTAYRQGGLSGSTEMSANNKLKFRSKLCGILLDLKGHQITGASLTDRTMIFRRALGAVLHKGCTWRMKLGLLPLLFGHLPRSLDEWRYMGRKEDAGMDHVSTLKIPTA